LSFVDDHGVEAQVVVDRQFGGSIDQSLERAGVAEVGCFAVRAEVAVAERVEGSGQSARWSDGVEMIGQRPVEADVQRSPALG